jgi:O-antigen/teichoic acid export membrane protein
MLTLRQLLRSRAARIAGFSYAAFAANSLCALFSIPLAVAYLGKEQIALWTLVTQIVSYLVWMDLGVGSALSRKIADPIASGDQKEINAWWTLSMAVLGAQGILLLAAAALAWPLWVAWFGIGSALRADALWLYSAAALGAAVSMPLRAYPGLLLAQQRYVWVPASQCLSPLFQLGVFASCLNAGLGVRAYFFGMIAAYLAGWTLLLFAVHAGPLKVRFARAGFTLVRAFDLFRFSGSVALIGLSQTITQTLPSLMLGRFGGLALVPVYTFSNRIPEILGNLTLRTTMAFYPALQAHFVEERRERFARQFREVQGLTLSLGLLAAAFILAGNRAIISWLATPDFFVGAHASLWFAVAALILPYGRTFTHLLQYSGDMGKSALVSILPVLAGAALGWPAYQAYGLAGLAAVFALVPTLILGLYSAIRGSRNCGYPTWQLCGGGITLLAALISLLLLCGAWCLAGENSDQSIILYGRDTLLPSAREWMCGVFLITISFALSVRQLRRIRNFA